MPSTSQATIQAFADVFQKLHAEGYDILNCHFFGTLRHPGFRHPGQEIGTRCQYHLVRFAKHLAPIGLHGTGSRPGSQAWRHIRRMHKIVETVREHTQVFFAVDTLEFLHRGGRIGGASRFLGTALGLKPILYLEEGKIEALEKVRTSKRAHSRLVELVEEGVEGNSPINFVGVVHAASEKTATNLLKVVESEFNPKELMLASISPVLGTHTGPGTIGIAYVAGVDPDLLQI
jgi:fatty acid-binding protein DegV